MTNTTMSAGRPLPPVPQSVVHMLRDAAAARPDALAMEFEGTRLSYREYEAAVAGLARSWSGLVNPGDRVALVLPNSLDLAVATYAAHALRAQVAALNPGYTLPELAQMLADATPSLVVHDPALTPHARQACEGLDVRHFEAVEGGAAFARLRDSDARLPEVLPCHDDLATLQYTGGTTGRSKGVDITHRQLAYNLAQREALLPTRYGGETVLCIMPLFHVSAVAMSLHLACYCASALIIHRRFVAAEALQTIAERSVTVLSGAPAIYLALVEQMGREPVRLDSLRACYSGAAPLPAETLRRWEALGASPILEGYGMSEAGPCVTYNPAAGVRKVGSVGVPVPGSEVRIVDPAQDGRVFGPGQAGELAVRGPHVMRGYRNLPERTAAVLRDGWMHSGDIAEMDADGYVFIKGRLHDTINVGGFKVYPREVEEVLLAHPDVVEAAAFAAPHPYYGQVVHAWVVPRGADAAGEQALIEHCAQRLVRYKVPHAIGHAATLPKTSVGKLARNALKAVRAGIAADGRENKPGIQDKERQ